jgi:hypothetical protein
MVDTLTEGYSRMLTGENQQSLANLVKQIEYDQQDPFPDLPTGSPAGQSDCPAKCVLET